MTASALLEHISIYPMESDGQDDSGNQKWRVMSPGDVANRALDIAQAFVFQAKERGFLIWHAPPAKE